MINRRSIRVKVMQTLYSLSVSDPANKEQSEIRRGIILLDEKLSQSLNGFTTSILYTLSVAQYAEKDARLKASKFISEEGVSTKIAGNEFMWQVLSNETFQAKIKEAKLERFIDEDRVKKLYQQLVQTDTYIEYISLLERKPKAEKAIIQFIWEELILKHETLQEIFVDELPGYEDDKEMIGWLMENFFRSHQKVNFLDLLSGEKKKYAYDMLRTVIDKGDYCMELITPKLKNWEAERIAQIDLILLRMGLCEFLYFPNIPPKVTINEYIEVAKLYSTPQSGQFVNGVLDNLRKELEQNNQIRKQDETPKP